MTHSLTHIFKLIRSGDKTAEERLFLIVYSELRQIARVQLRFGPKPSLQSGDLVHEAYLKLERNDAKALSLNRAYFFAAAVRAMRQIVIDHNRKWRPQIDPAQQNEIPERRNCDETDIRALDKSLKELADYDSTLAQIVELRVFAGLTIEEVAKLCGIGTATVSRKFRAARAFLRSRIEEHMNDDTSYDGASPENPRASD